jgi:sulfate permease, SulP family
MDITGLQTLEGVIQTLMKRGVSVVLTEANQRVRNKLERIGIIDMIGTYNYYQDFAGALVYCGSAPSSPSTPLSEDSRAERA